MGQQWKTSRIKMIFMRLLEGTFKSWWFLNPESSWGWAAWGAGPLAGMVPVCPKHEPHPHPRSKGVSAPPGGLQSQEKPRPFSNVLPV